MPPRINTVLEIRGSDTLSPEERIKGLSFLAMAVVLLRVPREGSEEVNFGFTVWLSQKVYAKSFHNRGEYHE